jgi:hypothetical protein
MAADVFPHSVGMLLVGDRWSAQIGCNKLMIRYVKSVRTCWLLRADRRATADVRRRDLEFAVGDEVLLKVSPTKGIVRFGTRGKLNPRYI